MNISEIEAYLLANPVDRTQRNPYLAAARALKVDKEKVRRAWRNLRKKGLVEAVNQTTIPKPETVTYSVPGDFHLSYRGSTAEVAKVTDREIKNELDLAEDCDIDLDEWKIIKWECKRYNAWIKNKDGEIESQPKYSVSAKMERRVLDKEPELQKTYLLQELCASAPEILIFEAFPEGDHTPVKDTLLEISIPDLHISKLSWGEEVGEDFDLKIVCQRYESAINELLSRTNLDRIERIVLPIGNDMINVDNASNTTTGGTPQSVDGRFPKIIRVAKELLISNILKLAAIAPVDVLVVPGNHDYHTMFMIGEILSAYFHNTERIQVNNSPKPRKYYKYGNCGFMYAHGNEEKHQELGLIFATEEPELWASVKHRVAKLGHYHKSKKTNWVSVDEHQGFQVEILPSLSATDIWHYKKGYMSQKAAKSFLYHVEKGKLAEYTFTV